ncbi:unnamed protein product [Effrenium voratum]|uniref:Peptidase C1A papain C-terminal domain-containing protein n=1 Tax=Effrenium voratum TaxID=2562239 RepID=A0AA36NLW8_9DINO|nr:unnamed protein product [Effrenium voratum]
MPPGIFLGVGGCRHFQSPIPLGGFSPVGFQGPRSSGHSYQLGVTEFADQAPEEFASGRFGLAKSTRPWADLPYLGRDEFSGKAAPDSIDWTSKGAVSEDMDALMEAVSQQPVSVAIEADQTAFQLYKGGILTQECGKKLDHGVLLVGYGTENGVDYWKVKNSWGANWGENGYIRMKRGVPKDGECGIKDQPSYPVVKAKAALAPHGSHDF